MAVIDSGVDADHPDLDGCVDVANGLVVSVGKDGEIDEVVGPHRDVFGHGTACAGIIHELAPEASITSIRVLGPRLAGKAKGFLHGLSWAIEQGFDVVNLSLGTNRREWALPFYELCDEAFHRNVIVVTAANNLPSDSFPSMFGTVFSSACHLGTDPLRFHYNPTPPPEFLARGVDVEVAWRDGTRITTTGNSFAAPHISGFAALVRARYPGMRPYQVKGVLWSVASNVLEAPALGNGRRGATRSVRLTQALPTTR